MLVDVLKHIRVMKKMLISGNCRTELRSAVALSACRLSMRARYMFLIPLVLQKQTAAAPRC